MVPGLWHIQIWTHLWFTDVASCQHFILAIGPLTIYSVGVCVLETCAHVLAVIVFLSFFDWFEKKKKKRVHCTCIVVQAFQDHCSRLPAVYHSLGWDFKPLSFKLIISEWNVHLTNQTVCLPAAPEQIYTHSFLSHFCSCPTALTALVHYL